MCVCGIAVTILSYHICVLILLRCIHSPTGHGCELLSYSDPFLKQIVIKCENGERREGKGLTTRLILAWVEAGMQARVLECNQWPQNVPRGLLI